VWKETESNDFIPSANYDPCLKENDEEVNH